MRACFLLNASVVSLLPKKQELQHEYSAGKFALFLNAVWKLEKDQNWLDMIVFIGFCSPFPVLLRSAGDTESSAGNNGQYPPRWRGNWFDGVSSSQRCHSAWNRRVPQGEDQWVQLSNIGKFEFNQMVVLMWENWHQRWICTAGRLDAARANVRPCAEILELVHLRRLPPMAERAQARVVDDYRSHCPCDHCQPLHTQRGRRQSQQNPKHFPWTLLLNWINFQENRPILVHTIVNFKTL